MRLFTLVMILALAACSPGPALGGPSGPAGGVVIGRLVSQRSDGSSRAPVAGQAIGVFTQAVIPGKVIQHPPAPITTPVTSSDRTFTFRRLEPGRYFITIAGVGPSIARHWARLTSATRATVPLTQ